MRALKALVAMAVAAAFCVLGQPVQAGVVPPCTWDVGTRTLVINLIALGGSEAVHVGRVPDSNQLGYLTIDDWVPCPAGTVNSANLLVVNGTVASDSVVVNLVGGKLAPGHTAEAKGQSELEVDLLLDAGTDNVELRGGPTSNTFELRSTTKAALNGDNDADVTFSSVARFHLNGAGGNDALYAPGAAARLTGGNGADDLVGSAFDDELCGDCGGGTGDKDVLIGQGGNDELSGGPARDIYDGGDGADLLRAGGGADLMYGSDGADTFETGNSPDGGDVLRGGLGRDLVSYESRSDGVLIAQDKSDNDGEDDEGDKVGKDIEEIVGTPFDDEVMGSSLDQHIWGLAGGDDLNGGNGDDVIEAGTGDDFVAGNDGDDELVDEAGYDDYRGGDDRDTFTSEVSGGYDDTYRGGAGVDTMDYSIRTDPMQIDVTDPDGDGVDDESDDVRPDIEKIYGGDSFDRIIGGAAANTIYGLDGADALYGGGGPDTIYGGEGDDSLDGQEGADELYGEAGLDDLFGADGAADILACGADGGDVQEYDSALDSVSDCNVPM